LKKIVISSIVASLVAVSTAQAFEGQKQGFMLSVGAGLSSITTEVGLSGYYGSADETSTGFATSFKIGYGFTNQFLLYYMNDVSWYGFDDDPYDDTYTSGFTGVDASYYVEENSPAYVLAGIGLGSFTNFSEDAGETGSSFVLGAGYEVTPHLNIEGTYLVTSIEEDGVELDTDAFRLTLNYMWY